MAGAYANLFCWLAPLRAEGVLSLLALGLLLQAAVPTTSSFVGLDQNNNLVIQAPSGRNVSISGTNIILNVNVDAAVLAQCDALQNKVDSLLAVVAEQNRSIARMEQGLQQQGSSTTTPMPAVNSTMRHSSSPSTLGIATSTPATSVNDSTSPATTTATTTTSTSTTSTSTTTTSTITTTSTTTSTLTAMASTTTISTTTTTTRGATTATTISSPASESSFSSSSTTSTTSTISSSYPLPLNTTFEGQYQVAAQLNGLIYISTNFGTTWSPTGLDGSWGMVCISATGRYMLAANAKGAGYSPLISRDFGASWSWPSSFATPSANNAGPPSSGNACSMSLSGQYQSVTYYHGASGVNLRYVPIISSDFGQTWQVPSPFSGGYTTSPNFCSPLVMSSSAQYQIVSCSNSAGGFQASKPYMSSNYGSSFLAMQPSSLDVYMSLSGRYMVSGSGQVSDDYGASWRTSTGASWTGRTFPIAGWTTALSATGQYRVTTSGGGGGGSVMYVSSDYGASWAPTGLTQVWSGSALVSHSGQNMRVCTSSNVFVSSNFGKTWTMAPAGTTCLSSTSASQSLRFQSLATAALGPAASSNFGATATSPLGSSSSGWTNVAVSYGLSSLYSGP